MKNIILTDHVERDHLLPLTLTRPVGHLRVGLWKIYEKWEQHIGANVSFRTQDYLTEVFPEFRSGDDFYLNGGLLPEESLIAEIQGLKDGQMLCYGDQWIATRSSSGWKEKDECEVIELSSAARVVARSWQIFQWNEEQISSDLELIRSQRKSQVVPEGVTAIGDDIFIEEGATVLPCILNSNEGPIYIGKNATIMEGSMIRGPFALMESSQIKMGAKIYGATTIGPHCKVGGEVNNCVLFGYSNKAHDGFIGNSVIGEWCNLGADTNTSNLKNNYSVVKIHNYALGRSESTGTQFCGLTMADHAKAGINTMFNTGTVCGIFTNVFGAGFPHRRIPSFGWGGAEGFKNYRLADALDVAEKVMSRRGIELTEEWKKVYTELHQRLTDA